MFPAQGLPEHLVPLSAAAAKPFVLGFLERFDTAEQPRGDQTVCAENEIMNGVKWVILRTTRQGLHQTTTDTRIFGSFDDAPWLERSCIYFCAQCAY
ncbi:MAG: hypothetical protein OER85_13195 [Gammaproteobacteria bacterium]|nr:hypothetical protein [Gammaproteobacteria bacterium]